MAVLLLRPQTTFSLPLIRIGSYPKSTRMALKITTSSSVNSNGRMLPILLFDVMDTIVRDPFYQDIPAFFWVSFKELIDRKHPTAWIEFEEGRINEMELARNFFSDGRPLDLEGKRKPDPAFYLQVLMRPDADPKNCIFIDDRVRNVDAATKAGIIGLQFKNANLLRQDFSLLGIDIDISTNYEKQDLMKLSQEHLP